MFKSASKTLALAIVTGSLLAGTMASPSFARDGGGDRPRVHACHHANCQHVKKVAKKKVRKARKGRNVPWASAYDPATGNAAWGVGIVTI